jgi:hypothetical protein
MDAGISLKLMPAPDERKPNVEGGQIKKTLPLI